jgi:uncharacterized protein
MNKKNQLIIEDESIEIRNGATILFGFAGLGLLGPIIANTLIEQIPDMEKLGFVTSEIMSPIAVFYDGVLKHPFRLCYSKQNNLIVGICEIPLQTTNAYDGLSEIICKWALSEKAREIVTFQGLAQRGIPDEFPVYYAAEEEMIEKLEGNGIKKLKRGIIVGPEATFLNRALTNRIKAYALFTPVSQYPTPEGAASIIEVLNDLYDINIDTSSLIEKGKEIKKKLSDLAEKAQEYRRKQLEGSKSETPPQLYR